MKETSQDFAFERENYILLAIGFIIIIIGFMLMSGGGTNDPTVFYPNGDESLTPEIFSFRRITLATIVVLFGFAFEFFAILARPDSKIVKKLFRK
jgi:hypothetical protein